MFNTLVYNFVEYGIYLKGGTNLNYDMTPLYSMTVECSDTRRNDTGHFTVNLIRNSSHALELDEQDVLEVLNKYFGAYIKSFNTSYASQVEGEYAPVINSLPDSVSLLEDVNTNTLLHTLNVTDIEGDNITCVLNPNSSLFEVSLIPPSNIGGTNLNYDIIPLYTMAVECSDVRRNNTGNFTVNLIRNMAPVINSLPDSESLLEDVNTNTLLHTLNVTDIEGDNITCVLNPNSSLFEVSLNPLSNIEYGIYLKGGTNLNYDMFPLYTMAVECSDVRRNNTGYFTVNLNRNMAPVINSLPDSVSLLEDVNTNTLLHTLNVTDIEGDNLTCVLNPNSSLFEVSLIPHLNIEYGIYLTGGTTLDYESTPSYSLTVQCRDLRRQNTKREDVNTNMLLHTLNVMDIEGDNTNCFLNPNSSIFEVSLIPSSNIG
ncbi:unnamed protein product [Mytilus coruscus]|uniref:Uncharacterized protein n=1 Tax=Mytilus coruscus TaxID=42192 RepID=A0A6J8B3P1_MYTCO|nr:unnamed protein product [Mytilus coruscus]